MDPEDSTYLPFSPFFNFESLEPESDVKPEPDESGNLSPGLPRPMEALYETPVPPFLSKTYDLVEDPSLDRVISWGVRGDSFVVLDPVEFSRVVLPRNFKHNNFSSFVRQLNTYGFRKVDSDRWEFANQGFIKGQRHLLKNIQRRKSPSHQLGSSSASVEESGKAALESEIEQLRKERSLMMREVSELQSQHRGALQHMKAVDVKLQEAERRQKQMVSFLGKVFQNPAFMARLREARERKSITSPRTTRRFVKHQAHEPGSSDPSLQEIVKYREELSDYTGIFSQTPEENLVFGSEVAPFKIEDLGIDEMAMIQNFLATSEQTANVAPTQNTFNPLDRGKGVMDPQFPSNKEYFVSFSEDLAKGKSIAEFSMPESEHIAATEGIWSMGSFEDASGAGISSSATELWSDIIESSDYDLPEVGGLSDVWDLGTTQPAGSSSAEKHRDEEEHLSSEKRIDEDSSSYTYDQQGQRI